jgi:hypothetical protein
MSKKNNKKNEPSAVSQKKTDETINDVKPSVEEVRNSLRFTIVGDIVEPLNAEDWGSLSLQD